MQRTGALQAGLIVAVIAILITSGLMALGSSSGTPVGPVAKGTSGADALADASSVALPSSASATLSERVHTELAASQIPARDVYLPNFNAQVPIVNQAISPLYTEAP